jgi:Ser/Thr protein kinase RdoA (MazF antagonist)
MSASLGIPRVPRPSRVSSYVTARLGAPAIDASTVRAVLRRYDLETLGRSRNLRLARRSLNAVVATGAGVKVVKCYRPQWTPSTVAYGHSIMRRMEVVEFPAVRLLRMPDAGTWVGIDDRVFAVFDFVPGTNYSLNYLRRSDRLALTAIAGTTLARFHQALVGFTPDGEHHLGFSALDGPRRRDAAWHAAKLDELKRASAALTAPDAVAMTRSLSAHSDLLATTIDRLERRLDDACLPRLVIHGDYGLHNLLFSRSGAVPVDFEVSRLDWRCNDLISVLGKHRYRGGHYDFESMCAFLAAYGTCSALTTDESRLLPDAWRLYKLQAAVQYWNSYFETRGPVRKLASALDAIDQAAWVVAHPELIAQLGHAASARALPRSRVGRRFAENAGGA